MEDLKKPAVMGKKIFNLLKKNKILLLQDKVFPNIVTEITGERISGSWWGHPLANPIYNGLQWINHNHSILTIKLIDGKITYIHESLFADIYSIVCKLRDWQAKKLKDEDQQILKYVLKNTSITSDNSALIKLSKDPKKSFLNLEKKLLVYSVEKHTEAGKHIKEYMPWKKSKIAIPKPIDYLTSKERIETIVTTLSKNSGANVNLPWS